MAARAGLSRTWDAALAPAELLAPQLLSAAPPPALCHLCDGLLCPRQGPRGPAGMDGRPDGQSHRVLRLRGYTVDAPWRQLC